jgi:methylenetetrahydrofolate dehydrogenase (NADP+) / methenyltetrahydrofolate cyclohydrolase
MIVDGKKIARAIYESVAHDVSTMSVAPVLAAITCEPNFETQKYLELKKRKAAEVGITLRVIELPATVTTQEVVACVRVVASEVDGVVVQLPFPAHIDREVVLSAVPIDKDPDGFAYAENPAACLPPVVGAIKEIAQYYSVSFAEKQVVVLGAGRLVGSPAVRFLHTAGAEVTISTEHNGAQAQQLLDADIIVSGIGEPYFITVDKVKHGVVVFDAGTSEDGGLMVGDVHPDVVHVASLFTPVPGGIGPITIALLLRNVVQLTGKVQNI